MPRIKRDTRIATLALLISAATLICAGQWVTVNLTASEPVGLWLHVQAPATVGDFVLICPPTDDQSLRYLLPGRCGGNAPLIKQVAALPGDTVEVSGGVVAVNRQVWETPPLASDSNGHILLAVTPGRYAVKPGQVWVLSTFSPKSYDSRYFGPLPLANVISTVVPLWTAR